MASNLRPLTRRIQPFTILRSAVILLALLLAPGSGPAWAQGRSAAPDPSSPESLTQSLVGLAALLLGLGQLYQRLLQRQDLLAAVRRPAARR